MKQSSPQVDCLHHRYEAVSGQSSGTDSDEKLSISGPVFRMSTTFMHTEGLMGLFGSSSNLGLTS